MPESPELPAVEIRPQDLPVFCPNAQMPLWSTHPRVFLDVAETGQAACPYCGTRYRLTGEPPEGRPLAAAVESYGPLHAPTLPNRSPCPAGTTGERLAAS